MIIRDVTRYAIFVGSAITVALTSATSAQAPPPRMNGTNIAPSVRVTGCLKLDGKNWVLASATDPVPDVPPKEPAAMVKAPAPSVGRNQFQLIGVDVFHLPKRKDQRVEITGLLISAKPMSRINLTTVAPVAPTCSPIGKQ